jgi:hypothetical protein
MSENEERNSTANGPRIAAIAAPPKRISLDTWAVLFALAAALLIRTGVLKHIPW